MNEIIRKNERSNVELKCQNYCTVDNNLKKNCFFQEIFYCFPENKI